MYCKDMVQNQIQNLKLHLNIVIFFYIIFLLDLLENVLLFLLNVYLSN